MREIAFRGKHIHAFEKNEHLDGTWIFGYLCNESCINSPELKGEFLIDKDTVGQYIGIKDKNKKEIYEGDIVRRKIFNDYIIGEVVRHDIGFCGFMLKCGNSYYHIGKSEHTGISDDDEVIGNIFDNEDLLHTLNSVPAAAVLYTKRGNKFDKKISGRLQK